MRILLAEDDRFLADGLSLVLKDSGYAVDVACTGSDADIALSETTYDLLILDLGLPKLDGIELLKRLRIRGQSLPVLILTARDRLEDRVNGLDLGANDYMTKPFQLPELEARIRALLRKDLWANRTEVTFGPLSFNTVTRTPTVDGQQVDLSARELAILEIMIQRTERIVSKDQIIDLLSSWDTEITFNAIGIAVHRLRKKLEPHSITIRAIRGLGYRIEESN
jgi:two-component system OmpR family response regulator